jgi:hypothetical protein
MKVTIGRFEGRNLSLAIAGIVVVLVAAIPLRARGQDKVVSVCQVLASLRDFDGKIIAIRGMLYFTGEATILKDNCSTQVETNGYIWPSAISIVRSDELSVRRAVPFRSDKSAERKLLAALDHPPQESGPPQRVIVTVKGLLDAPTLAAAKRGNGRLAVRGTGSSFEYPAQLIYHTFAEIRRVPELPQKGP